MLFSPISASLLLLSVTLEVSAMPTQEFIHRLKRVTASLPEYPTDEEMVNILHVHNQLRRARGASNMQHLKWNAELALKAIELANTCEFEHAMLEWPGAPYSRVGQNLYLGDNSTYTHAIHAWHDEEIGYYNYATITCTGMCGHYTQAVWDETREVGCGRHFCSRAVDPEDGAVYDNVYYIACDYGPPGNYPRRPYKKGAPCTECSDGYSMCNDGLCDTNCTGSHCRCEADCWHGDQTPDCRCTCRAGWRGNQCSVPCEDTHHECGRSEDEGGWPEAYCSEYDLVMEACPLLCGTCVPEPDG